MTNNPTLATMLLTAVLATGPLGATTIDDLQLAQSVDTGGTAATEVTAGGGELVLGGARDLAVVSDGSAVTAVAGAASSSSRSRLEPPVPWRRCGTARMRNRRFSIRPVSAAST